MTTEASWRELVEQHGEAIIRVAYRLLRNMQDAEDVAQQVLLESFAMKRIPDGGLLKRMATFRAIDRLRARTNAVPFDETTHMAADDEGERSIEILEQANRLRSAIARLPDRQARCFCLRYVEGLSNAEIAESLSISRSAVSTALNKARNTLRHSVSKEQEHRS